MHSTIQITNNYKPNLLSLNYKKKGGQFRTKNIMPIDSKIIYGNYIISNVSHTNFLGLVIDDILAWSNHIEEIVSK